jgi:YegS/Rv2252/BmrU family lipid kinase
MVVNPGSLNGKAEAANIDAILRERGVEIVPLSCTDLKQQLAAIKACATEADCLIAGGGDGTMNALAPLLMETGLPLGIVPMGTANDLARTLGIPAKVDEAVDIILQGRRRRIDLGEVNGRLFFNVAHVGLGVNVTRQVSSATKKRWGFLSYVRALPGMIRSARPFTARVICDGRERTLRTLQIAVGNGRHYGGGMTIVEHACIDDGLLAFYCVRPARLWELIRLAPLLKSGRFGGTEHVVCDTGHSIELRTRRPMPVTADGELVSQTPAKFTVHRNAVEVFVPADYAEEKEDAP